MKKRFLTITSQSGQTVAWKQREAYVKNFSEQLAQQFDGDLIAHYATYQSIAFEVINGVPRVWHVDSEHPLEFYDFVHFKNWMYELEMASVIARYLDRKGRPYANTEVGAHINLGKLSQMFELAWAGLPVPDTLIASNEELIKQLKNNSHFTFPLILKAVDGSKGDDNYLVKTHAALAKILKDNDKLFMVQQFIPNDGDIRLLFVGLEREPLVFGRKGDGSSHLNNTSKGGEGTFIPLKELDAQIRVDAYRAAEVLQREIGGVDIIVDKKTGKHYVLEVNATPAIATGYGADRKLEEFVSFLEESLFDDSEEE